MIDVIIPSYNGSSLLPACLDALRAQTRRDFRVTVVEDGGCDGTPQLLAAHYPEVGLLHLPTNRGLAAAVNAGIRATGGEFVVLLNNDTEAESCWLAQLVGALERFPNYAFAASKLLLYDRRDHLHSAGDFYQVNGVPGSRGVWQVDRGQYDAMSEVFGPCAGAAAYRRSALQYLACGDQVFDEDLLMYCEDVDLNVRARLHGLRTIYVPQARVYHRLSATGGGSLASYQCGRNFLLVWSKNMPAALLRRYWRHFFLAQLGYSVHSLRHIREPAARARLRGQFAGLRALPGFWAKRRHLPPDAEILEQWLEDIAV
jgi:GT2 family glycosyltransferase